MDTRAPRPNKERIEAYGAAFNIIWDPLLTPVRFHLYSDLIRRGKTNGGRPCF